MKLSKDQIEKIADEFANRQVDSMDIDTLTEIVYDQLNDYYSRCTAEEIEEEVNNYYCGDTKEWDNLVEKYTPPPETPQTNFYNEVVSFYNNPDNTFIK